MNLTFVTKPTTDGEKFTTRLSYGPDWTQAELDAKVHEAFPDVPAEQCALIARQYFLEIINSPAPRRCLRLFGMLRVAPTSGGTSPTPEGFLSPIGIKASVALTLLADLIRDWREGCTVQNVGSEGVAAPEIESVIDISTGELNTYTAEQNVRVMGDDLAFTRTDTTKGICIGPSADGPWTRLNTYGTISDENVTVLIPAATTGPIWIKAINDRGHMFVYTTPLTP